MSKRRSAFMYKALMVAVLILVGCAYWSSSHSRKVLTFRTSEVKVGDVSASISATGTIEPEQVVDLGAQVTGLIRSFGRDASDHFVDYGSVVRKGDILANIDDTLYVAAVNIDKAQLKQARANVVNANAKLALMRAKLWDTDADWRRARKLESTKALAATTYDQYKANYMEARANEAIAEAGVKIAVAVVSQADAQLRKDEENLAYCTVRSPVAGVVLDRRVNIGQTIVSSMSTSSLFLIAKDLKRIQVWASVNEADIGNIHLGQPVVFTVDAFGDKVFHGVAGKIRLNATMSQNVVTYTVEVNCDNADGKLLPYLTANLQFETGNRRNVLLVPNAALRWMPQPGQIASSRQAHAKPGLPSSRREDVGVSGGSGTLWIPEGNFVRPVHVRVGLTDGVFTEVGGERVAEGLHVVTGVCARGGVGNQNQGANPFIPQLHFFHGGGGSHH